LPKNHANSQAHIRFCRVKPKENWFSSAVLLREQSVLQGELKGTSQNYYWGNRPIKSGLNKVKED
jgi:hypothetical protein